MAQEFLESNFNSDSAPLTLPKQYHEILLELASALDKGEISESDLYQFLISKINPEKHAILSELTQILNNSKIE
jgi:hypothetical protein